MRPRALKTALIGVALALALPASRPARASDEPEDAPHFPAAPPLVPPRAIDAGRVAYPAGAAGDGVVILELLVGADGHVAEARVTGGVEPFATAAREAAGEWRFEPARRGEVSVAARVRMRVAFEAPRQAEAAPRPPIAAPEVEAPQGPSTASSADAGAPAVDVTVKGSRREAGQTRLGGGEVRQIPGAFGDAFRAIEALPGVTPIASGLPYFFVRGAPPGNTGYFLDGVRVPLLYHLGLGPSVVHPGLIERVDFYPGGYPARFGRFAGGVVSGETRPPAALGRPQGEASVRLFDAGALLETPFADGRGTALVGGRYSYTGAILGLIAPDTRLQYWDYQARATWELGDRDRVALFAFGSFDKLQNRDGQTHTLKDVLSTQFHRLDLRYEHSLGTRGTVRLAATLGRDQTGDDKTVVKDDLVAVRSEYEERLTSTLRARAGADVALDHYGLVQSVYDQANLLYPPRDNVVMGAYADVIWKIGSRVELVPGLRGDIFNSRRLDHPPVRTVGFDAGQTGITRTLTQSAVPSLDPRIAARVSLSEAVTWIATFGVSHQPPSFFVPVPGLQIGELRPSLQTSIQTSQGAEVALPADVTLTATAFFHDYQGLTDLTATCSSTNTSDGRDFCVDDRVSGRAYGLEVLLRRPLTRRLTGWLSYTLSRSTRDTHVTDSRRSEVVSIPSEFDRTHVLNAVAALDLGRGFRAGGRLVFYTGRPYSQTSEGIALQPYNGERLPSFYRVDVRVEKRWRLGETTTIALVLEGLNVTLRKEAVGVTCTPSTSRLDACVPDYIGPVTIPSIGVEAFF